MVPLSTLPTPPPQSGTSQNNQDRFQWLRVFEDHPYGIEHQVLDTWTQQTVILKKISDAIITKEEQKQALEKLAQVRELHHPNILPIYDLHCLQLQWKKQEKQDLWEDKQDPLSYYLSMANLPGIRLDRWLEQRCLSMCQNAEGMGQCQKRCLLPLQDVEKLARLLCDALLYAHKHQHFHQLLHPSQIHCKLSNHGELETIYLVGFGLRTLLPEQGLEVEAISGYLSPEQVYAQTGFHTDHTTDLFALGAIIYNLLTGECPYLSAQEQQSPQAKAILKQRFDKLVQGTASQGEQLASIASFRSSSRELPAIHPELEQTLSQMLDLQQENRPEFVIVQGLFEKSWDKKERQKHLLHQKLMDKSYQQLKEGAFLEAKATLQQMQQLFSEHQETHRLLSFIQQTELLEQHFRREYTPREPITIHIENAPPSYSSSPPETEEALQKARIKLVSQQEAFQDVESQRARLEGEFRLALFLLAILVFSGLFRSWSLEQQSPAFKTGVSTTLPTTPPPPSPKPDVPPKRITPKKPAVSKKKSIPTKRPAIRKKAGPLWEKPTPPKRRKKSFLRPAPLSSRRIIRAQKPLPGKRCPSNMMYKCYNVCLKVSKSGKCIKKTQKKKCRCLLYGIGNYKDQKTIKEGAKASWLGTEVTFFKLSYRGPLHPFELKNPIWQKRKRLLGCYRYAQVVSKRKREPLPGYGALTIRWSISAGGRARDIRFFPSEIKHKRLLRCLRVRFARILFPLPGDGGFVMARFKLHFKKDPPPSPLP